MTTKKTRHKPILEVPEAQLQGVVRTNLDHPHPTTEQRARRARTKKQILALSLPFTDHLPVIEDASVVILRSPEEIAARSSCVALAAVKAEGLEQKRVLELVDEWQLATLLTTEERAFINAAHPSEKDRQKFGWRYEGLHVLLWALGHRSKLLPPNQIVDVGPDVALIRKQKVKGLATHGKPRTTDEVLDANDLYYCLNWAATEVRLRNDHNEAVNGEIVVERHFALNWLIRYMGQEWDDVQTDT